MAKFIAQPFFKTITYVGLPIWLDISTSWYQQFTFMQIAACFACFLLLKITLFNTVWIVYNHININLYFAMYTAAPTLQYKNTVHSMQYSIKTTQSY